MVLKYTLLIIVPRGLLPKKTAASHWSNIPSTHGAFQHSRVGQQHSSTGALGCNFQLSHDLAVGSFVSDIFGKRYGSGNMMSIPELWVSAGRCIDKWSVVR